MDGSSWIDPRGQVMKTRAPRLAPVVSAESQNMCKSDTAHPVPAPEIPLLKKPTVKIGKMQFTLEKCNSNERGRNSNRVQIPSALSPTGRYIGRPSAELSDCQS